VPGLERIQPAERLYERLLHEVVGVAEVSRPPRQPTSCPAPQSREIALEECVQRLLVALPRALQQIERRGDLWSRTGARSSSRRTVGYPLIHSKDGWSGAPSLQIISRSRGTHVSGRALLGNNVCQKGTEQRLGATYKDASQEHQDAAHDHLERGR
jgi:hypothetical protein